MTDAGSQRRVAAAVVDLGARSRTGLRGSLHRVRGGLALAGQAGVAAALAWFIAHDLIGPAEVRACRNWG